MRVLSSSPPIRGVSPAFYIIKMAGILEIVDPTANRQLHPDPTPSKMIIKDTPGDLYVEVAIIKASLSPGLPYLDELPISRIGIHVMETVDFFEAT